MSRLRQITGPFRIELKNAPNVVLIAICIFYFVVSVDARLEDGLLFPVSVGECLVSHKVKAFQ